MTDLFGNIISTDQATLFAAPQTPPTFDAVPAPRPVEPPARSTRIKAARAAFERWINRPWGKTEATDRRIARQYKDTTATGELI
jgi:hypothetical protein